VIEDVLLSPAPTLVLNPDVSVSPTRTRRQFTAGYKRQFLDAAAACTRPGEIGALLRREGLYSSHLTAWRAADRQGEALMQRRGPAPTVPNAVAPRVAELERALAQTTRRVDRAELIVDAPQKFSQLIGLTLPPLDASRERAQVLAVLHEDRFVDLAPAQVYATLLDEGRYLCAERTMYRLLADAHVVRERRAQRRHPVYAAPELLATGPNQLWSWDISKLKGPATWSALHLCVVLDVFSRYVVGWMLAPRESAPLAE